MEAVALVGAICLVAMFGLFQANMLSGANGFAFDGATLYVTLATSLVLGVVAIALVGKYVDEIRQRSFDAAPMLLFFATWVVPPYVVGKVAQFLGF